MASIATLRDLSDALTETSMESDNIKNVISDLLAFFNLLSENEELKNILTTTAFEVEERREIISDISESLKMSTEAKNFLVVASELGKFSALLNKKDFIIRRLELAAGKLKTEITSARSLTENELSKIKKSLIKTTGKKIESSVSIDASIIGGLIIKIEGKVYDNSIKTRLEKLQSALTA